MTRRFRAATLWPWVVAGLVLHGLVMLLTQEWLPPPTAAPSARLAPTQTDPAELKLTQQELEVELLLDPSPHPEAVTPAPGVEHSLAVAPSPTSAATAAAVTTADAVTTAKPTATGESPSTAAPAATVAVAALTTDTANPASSTVPDTHAAAGAVPDVVGQNSTPQPPSSAKTPRSLAELGYGAPHAAALKPYLQHNPIANAQNRLDQNLAQAIVDRDRDRSVGIEGPITHAIHVAAMGVVVPTSLSKIAIIIDSNGKLADIEIISTNQDARALHTLSAGLKNLLANQTIRVPSGRAVEFTYEITSEVQLPSGRAPGLGVEALGLPLLKGQSDKSSKISILTPKFKFAPLSHPDPERNGKVTQTLPQIAIEVSIIGLDGDLVDLGAKGRQVIHTRLIQQRVL